MNRFLSLGLVVALGGCSEVAPPHRCPDLQAITVDAEGYIPWSDAQAIILGCDVKMVAQNHARIVSVHLNDGQEFRAVEPQIDDVLHLIKKHGLDKKISYATE